MNRIDLICTDLDGTLICGGDKPYEIGTFRYALNTCRTRWESKWAIITGRKLHDTRPVIAFFMGYNLRPDFVVAEDGLIYRRNSRSKLAPFWWWNFNVKRKRFHLGRRNAVEIEQWRQYLLSSYPDAVDRSLQSVDLWLEFTREEECEEGEAYLIRQVGQTSGFKVYRWGCELFLAFAIGTKGEAVAKLKEVEGLSANNIFAVGDGPNDLSMLSDSVVGMKACVGNALEKIKGTVRQGNGYVATKEGAAGVAEAINEFVSYSEDGGGVIGNR
ncbi:MAG: HAD family hydrolase [Lentisphaeria bacterium]